MTSLVKISGKNSGKDVSIVISDNQGNKWYGAELGILTHFEVSSDYAKWETKSIVNDGAVFHESEPRGAKASLKFARYSSALEDMESSYRKLKKAGADVQYTLQYQVKNKNGNGGVSTKTLTGGKPSGFKLGSYDPDKDVEQSVEFDFADISSTT